MFLAIAVHHPHRDHVDDLLEHMRLVIETVGQAPGLIEFTALRDTEAGRLVGFSRWESRADFEAALPRIGANRDRRRGEWTVADDDLLLLEHA
jgi:quinol monooxygenase YgiN